PANILLDGHGEPFVSDFGLARRLDEDSGLTSDNAIVGTPSYMAPEQACRQQATIASDVYGLGAVLYEVLTGRPPFQERSPLETLQQVVEATPTPLRRFSSQVPPDLETICLKCLEKEPDRRYATAEALADDLERWLRGEVVHARPVSSRDRLWRWCKRKPLVATLLGTVLLLVTALLIGSTTAVLLLRSAYEA